MYKHGLIATKAMPLHRGHMYLINRARSACEQVTVFVVDSYDQWPHASVRAEWVKEEFPDVNVRIVVDLDLPDNDPESSKKWAIYTKDILDGNMCDAIFSSEPYGQWWSDALGVQHVPIDTRRTYVPISGTKIRSDPYLYWQYIAPSARRHYLKRVLVVGAESTGKTTLCQKLAAKYGTLYVPEYGRIYVEQRGSVEDSDHRVIFAEILNHQPLMEEEIEKDARLVVFHDTDLHTTAYWYKLWQQEEDNLYDMITQKAFEHTFDLILVCNHDVPWIDDGLRDQADNRERFTNWFLTIYGARAKVLTGSWENRESAAIVAINELFTHSQVVLPNSYDGLYNIKETVRQ